MNRLYIKKRFRLVPSVYMLFRRDNKILLLKRKNTGYMDGFYGVPAGHLDGGETVTEAAIREAKEEVGVDMERSDLEFAHVMHRIDSDVPYVSNKETLNERVDFFMIVKKWPSEPRNTEPEKCSELKWFDMDNLPKETIPYIKKAIELVRDKVAFSEFGWN